MKKNRIHVRGEVVGKMARGCIESVATGKTRSQRIHSKESAGKRYVIGLVREQDYNDLGYQHERLREVHEVYMATLDELRTALGALGRDVLLGAKPAGEARAVIAAAQKALIKGRPFSNTYSVFYDKTSKGKVTPNHLVVEAFSEKMALAKAKAIASRNRANVGNFSVRKEEDY